MASIVPTQWPESVPEPQYDQLATLYTNYLSKSTKCPAHATLLLQTFQAVKEAGDLINPMWKRRAACRMIHFQSFLDSNNPSIAAVSIACYSIASVLANSLKSQIKTMDLESDFNNCSFAIVKPLVSEQTEEDGVVDLTDLSIEEEDPFVTTNALKDLLLEFTKGLDLTTFMVSKWTTTSLGKRWVCSLQDASDCGMIGLIQVFSEHINVSNLSEQWVKHAGKYYEACDMARSRPDAAALIYTLESLVSRSVRSSMRNEEYRLEWTHALKRFVYDGLAQVREVLRIAFNLTEDESGKATEGHRCITEKDKAIAAKDGSALLFGEFLATGVHRAFDVEHLDGYRARTVYDLGMGLGKLLMQVYMQYPNITKCVGVEISPSRYLLGAKALYRLVDHYPEEFMIEYEDDHTVSIKDKLGRVLEFREGNLFDCNEALEEADIIICETHFPRDIWRRICGFLSGAKQGCRVLTYENLNDLYSGNSSISGPPFNQQDINKVSDDRFYTTWSTRRGHHFYTWCKN